MNLPRSLVALAVTATALAATTFASADPIGDQFQISQQGAAGDTDVGVFGAAIASDTARKENLVVWVGSTDTTDEIFAQRITQSGARIGVPAQLSSDGDESTGEPVSVAYDRDRDRYLVSWETSDEDVRLRRVDGDGTPLGDADVKISDIEYTDMESTQAVYDPTAKRFLVVWKATEGVVGQQAWGQIVPGDGDMAGPDLQITTLVQGIDDAIDVAYNATAQQFAVAFHADSDGGDTEAWIQRLDANGARVGSEIQVSQGGTGGYQQPPRIAWNSRRNEYLVAWAGEAPSYGVDDELEIHVQRVTADGTELGVNDARVTHLGPDGATNYAPSRPDIAYHPEADEYMLVFHGDDDTPPLIDNANEIFGQALNGAGEETGSDDFRISETLPDSDNRDAFRPRIAYDADTCDYVAVWHTPSDTTDPVLESEVYGRVLDGPICAPRPTAPPAISGVAREGDTLTCSPGSYRFAVAVGFAWLRDGQPIPGATAGTYLQTAADVGHGVSCRSTGSNTTGSASQTTATVRPVARPAPTRLAVAGITVRVTPKRDRRRPYRYTTKGKIKLPAGVTAGDGCAGKVSVQVKRGKKTVSTRRAKVTKKCTFRSRVKFTSKRRLGGGGKLKFTVRFLGNVKLLPKRAARVYVRAG